MAVIGLVAHSGRPGAVALAARTAQWLESLGHEARPLDAGNSLRPGQPDSGEDDVDGVDLIVSLGGDGTMLRTVGVACPLGIPVLGVNFGHLGYLTVVEPDGLFHALTRFLAGDYQVEARMTLDIVVNEEGGAVPVLASTALNDVILQRCGSGHVVRVSVAVNGRPFVSYVADSVIVATPTGSTAYNLSARGPIVSPRARVQIVTPVAPHSLFDRSLVLDPTERISLRPMTDTTAELIIDGGPFCTLKPGQTVECTIGHRDALLVTFEDRDFQDILKRKFHLARA
jgi:NAD+ kinase